MHVKKKELLKLGLDEEMAKKVEAAIVEMLKNYIPKSRFDEVNKEKNKLRDKLKENSTDKTYAAHIKILKIIIN